MSILSFLLPKVSHVYLYPKPISMRLGAEKLTSLCENEMGIIPYVGEVFVFFNKDKMKLFYLDETGSQEILRTLPKGGFILPSIYNNQKYIKIESANIPSIFGDQTFQ